MNRANEHAGFDLENGELFADEQIAELTAKIRPLPANVVPSESFMQQMRRRLLALREQPKGPSKKAA